MSDVVVRCERGRADGWMCTVTLAQAGRHVSTHRVSVSAEDLDRLTPGAPDPTDLVERSFAFLLEREPPGSILSSFDLPLIGRYFPEYESTIRDRGERG
jgi:hypothetical protein